MTVLVAAGEDHGAAAVLVHAEEVVAASAGLDCVDGGLKRAVRAVFEAHGRGKAGGHLPVGLAFRSPRADGVPAHQIAVVLRPERIKRLRGDGQPHLGDLHHEFARLAHPLGDLKGAVHVRVVDEALPPGHRARLLEVDAHDEAELVADRVRKLLQASGIVKSRLRIMNRTGARHDEEPLVLALENLLDGLAARKNLLVRLVRERNRHLDLGGRSHGLKAFDVEVLKFRRKGLSLIVCLHC